MIITIDQLKESTRSDPRFAKRGPIQNKSLLGWYGEHYAKLWLISLGQFESISLSPDEFDSEKDITVDGSKVEVKTQHIYKNIQSLTVPLKHAAGKLKESLFNCFITVNCPNPNWIYLPGRVYILTPEFDYEEDKVKGKAHINVPKNEKSGALILDHMLTPEMLKFLSQFATTSF